MDGVEGARAGVADVGVDEGVRARSRDQAVGAAKALDHHGVGTADDGVGAGGAVQRRLGVVLDHHPVLDEAEGHVRLDQAGAGRPVKTQGEVQASRPADLVGAREIRHGNGGIHLQVADVRRRKPGVGLQHQEPNGRRVRRGRSA